MKILLTTIVLASLILSSCTNKTEQSVAGEVVKGYADLVLTNYQDSLETAQELRNALYTFVEAPSKDTQNAAKKSWLKARVFYDQTEAYRFYNGPIDDEDGPEGLLNAWPLDEAYIDYVKGNENAGIVNNVNVEISKSQLIKMNEANGDENISTGYHAIEFLLWGQDLSKEEAGKRSHNDYVDVKNAKRRGDYLKIVADLLVENLETLVSEWSENKKDNYRAKFLALNHSEAIHKILTGLHELSTGELPGERMAVALTNHDQEDEHSCFSDNTCLDIRDNQRSMVNVYLGTYAGLHKKIEVKGIHYWLKTKDESLATSIKSKIASIDTFIAKMSKHRFDRLIASDNPEGNKLVKNTIKVLSEQGELFAKALKKIVIK
ncbi:imelysin family protein [Candidatus Uabimicrobium sp. HlEnr_7]|uniref:imelysin family protein n=1 Tax=Candidatus Uabimicrobium helgolandensis TaxID=3095367 RepID=UPI0035577629